MSIVHRLGAWSGLLRRYGRVFSYYWAHRASLNGGLFNEQEAEFLPAALSLQERPVSRTARLTGWLLMAFVAIALLWSVLGKIDIVVTASGKIIPSGYTKTISSVEIAAVRGLHVREGQAVKAGDLLIELDTSATDAEHDKAQSDEMLARLQMARSEALIDAVDHHGRPRLPALDGIPADQREAAQRVLDGQYEDFQAKLQRIDGDIVRYGRAAPLAAKTASNYRALSVNHDVSEQAAMEKEQASIDLEGQLTDARNQRTGLIAETRKEAQDALVEGKRNAEDSRQDALRAGEHSHLLRLTAPVDGTVQQLTVHTVGGVVPAAQPLMMIVPRQKQVEVEAFLENKDIGFVKEGQAASVKVDAFEYTKYGTVPGHVVHVSRDAIQDDKKGLIYAVRIALDHADINVDGASQRLSAGMSVNAEIKTGTRRAIEYVLSPLIQQQREALHER